MKTFNPTDVLAENPRVVRESILKRGIAPDAFVATLSTAWPDALLALKAEAWPGENSVVDTIERKCANHGADAFKVWYAETFGVMAKQCNCAAMATLWRVRFAYDKD